MNRRERVSALDSRLYRVARRVKILNNLAWPSDAEQRFLSCGGTELPEVSGSRRVFSEEKEGLQSLLAELDTSDPLEAFLERTARSYLTAIEMLESVGTSRFTECSVQIYGQPSDRLHTGSPSHFDLSARLLAQLDGYPVPATPQTFSSEEAAEHFRARINSVFTEAPLPVVVDSNLISLAAAGANRVRLRGGTHFSETQINQLFEHEAMVHSATKRNGRLQPVLKSLGLSSPRTTVTQEGLATLAELVTGVMDLQRLRRISRRVQATSAALDGADFLQVFQMHREWGQDERESFRSTARLFRGGDVRGGVVLTKDVVYLRGLVEVHAFLRVAIQQQKPELIGVLFSGRLSLHDVISLESEAREGWVAPPAIMPRWASNLPCLISSLTWMLFDDLLHIEEMKMTDSVLADS